MQKEKNRTSNVTFVWNVVCCTMTTVILSIYHNNTQKEHIRKMESVRYTEPLLRVGTPNSPVH